MDITIFPPEEIIETEIALPYSKSLSNRALIMNALTPAASPLAKVAKCDDTDAMVAALAAVPAGEVYVGPAGTAMRFLTAYFAALPGADVTLCGNERMHHRPIGPLVEALRSCGALIDYAGEEGFPPLRIRGTQLKGGDVEMDASVSSQFVSALLMVAPTFDLGLTLHLQGEIASLPYLEMTLAMMRRRGINAECEGGCVMVKRGTYLALSQSDVEPDWSAASYWYSIAALSAGWVTLPGLSGRSLQGDSVVAQIFEKLGVVTEYTDTGAELSASPEMHSRLDVDMSSCPDLVQTLAVACCMLSVPFRFAGVRSLRIKETDRLQALQRELAKLSYVLEVEGDNILSWEGARCPVQALDPIDTYGDHRMAMAFAPAALYASGLVIRGAEVVSKSYPGYWDDMRHAGFTITDTDGTQSDTEQ